MVDALFSSWVIIAHLTVIWVGDIHINISIDWISLSVTAGLVVIIRTLLK